MIRITGYGVIAEKPRVGKLGHFFRAPYRKNYALDQKMNDNFYDGHDELYHRAKFGEDCTMRAGCRCESVVFFCLFVCHAPSPEHRAFEGYIFRTSFVLPFIVRFRRGFQRFLFGRGSTIKFWKPSGSGFIRIQNFFNRFFTIVGQNHTAWRRVFFTRRVFNSNSFVWLIRRLPSPTDIFIFDPNG